MGQGSEGLRLTDRWPRALTAGAVGMLMMATAMPASAADFMIITNTPWNQRDEIVDVWLFNSRISTKEPVMIMRQKILSLPTDSVAFRTLIQGKVIGVNAYCVRYDEAKRRIRGGEVNAVCDRDFMDEPVTAGTDYTRIFNHGQ